MDSDSLSIRPRLPLYFGQKGHFKVKIALKLWICFLQTHSFWLLKTLTDGLEWYGLLVMFLSAVWTLILTAPIHCRGSIGEQVMQCYISPNLMKKKLIYILDHQRVSTFPFCVNYSFKHTFKLILQTLK